MKQRKFEIYKDLIPIYKYGDKYLVKLINDIPNDGSLIQDSMVVLVKSDGTYNPEPIGGQKMMKWCGAYCIPITKEETDNVQKEVFSNFSLKSLQEIKQILTEPPLELIKRLLYIPPRFLEKYQGILVQKK